jgi:vacuolar iron transporter family protein
MNKIDYVKGGHEEHKRSNFLSDFILGAQDGLVNILGIVLGVSAATSDIKILFVAALAALGAETISMGAVAYTSTSARRKQYLKAVEQEKREMVEVPDVERAEVRDIFKSWGYKGKELESITDKIVSNPKAWLEFMMSHELMLSPIEKSQPMRSFVVVGLATVLGSVIPILPFFYCTADLTNGAIVSVIISGITLFFIGVYEAKVTVGSIWTSGMRMLIIGLTAGLAGYLIGHFIGAVPI